MTAPAPRVTTSSTLALPPASSAKVRLPWTLLDDSVLDAIVTELRGTDKPPPPLSSFDWEKISVEVVEKGGTKRTPGAVKSRAKTLLAKKIAAVKEKELEAIERKVEGGVESGGMKTRRGQIGKSEF